MQRWMDDQDTFQGTQPGYWYDDGQPEPTYGTQADVEAAIEAVRQQEASQPAPSAPAAPSAPSVSYNAGLEDLSGANYSPETVAYLNNLDNQRQALMAKYGAGITLNNPEFMSSRYVQQPASDGYDKVYSSEEDIRRMMGQDASSIYNPGYDVQSWGGSRSPTVFDMVRLGADQTYTYTDNNTGQTYTASTPEQVQALTQLAKSQSGVGNNSASWSIKDSSGKEVASDTSYTPSFLKQTGQTISDLLVEYGPSILAIPMTGGMSLGALMATAGGTAAVGKLLKTGDLQKSIITGLTSAATAGALKVSGASDFIGKKLGEYGISMPTGASTAPSFAGPSSTAFSGVDLSSTLPGFAAGTSFGGAVAPPSGASEAIQVGLTKGAAVPVASGLGSLAGNVAGNALPQGPRTYTDAQGVERGTVTDTKIQQPGLTAPALGNIGNSGTYTDAQGVERGTVTDTKLKDGTIDPESGLPHVPFTIPDYSYAMEPMDTPYQQPEESKLDTSDKVKLALAGVGLLGGLAGGGGGSGSGGTVPAGFENAGKMPESFKTDKLPTGDDIPAYGGGTSPASRTARDMGDIDYNRYGFNPEKSFFNNVPQRAAKGGSMAVSRPSKSFAVRGAGDGRSDDIPAVLSDGEYVMDAETVALLGNGSNQAGAAQLDRFRANVRKHKGKDLAKGRFSVNAKNPQAYMAGGRT